MTVAHEVPPQGFRTFVLLWASQSVSALGSALTLFAVNIWLTQVRYPLAAQKPQLALALSWTSLSFMLPTIFAGPLAGAWADRHDRRRTMMAMNFSAFLLSGAFVGLLVSGRLDVWVLLGFLAVYALLGAFHTASFETSYAMLVPVSQVARATGMMQTTMALSYVISPALAALLIGWPALARRGFAPDLPGAPIAHLADGTALAVGIDCATFLLATVALLGLHVPSPHRPDLAGPGAARKTLWHDIREGGLFVWHRRPMLWLIGWMTYPMGVALAGWLGARFDPGMATAALGVCLAAFALLQLVNPMLMRIEDRAWLEAFAARSERRGAPAAEPPAGA